MDEEKVFPKIAGLLHSWGIEANDWFVVGKLARRLAGFTVPERGLHVNVAINVKKLPWRVEHVNYVEAIPPKGSEYLKQYLKFITETGWELDLKPMDKKLYESVSKEVTAIGGATIQYAHILDNIRINELSVSHHSMKQLGPTKARRLLLGLQNLRNAADPEDAPEVIKACDAVLKKYASVLDAQPDADALEGTPIGRGSVTGKVLLMTDDFQGAESPVILVAKEFSTKLVAYLHNVVGIISESGGLLSHQAIIAREWHIPAVLNVHGATRLLENGDEVVLDLALGRVTKLD